jgi:hypothetical protein
VKANPICRSAWGATAILSAALMACNDPVKPRDRDNILGYDISGQANGTDPATGDELTCVFIVDFVETGGPLIGTWTDTASIRVIRARKEPALQVTYDTIIAAQEVTVSVADSFHIQVALSGVLTENLSADMVPAYPGFGTGEWTCRPEHPLSRVQPDAVLNGAWTAQPYLDIPIG